MRLNTYLSDGGIHEIISVDSIEEAREVLRQKFECEQLTEAENSETIEFFDPKRDVTYIGWLTVVRSSKINALTRYEIRRRRRIIKAIGPKDSDVTPIAAPDARRNGGPSWI